MSLDIQKIRSDFPFFDKSDLAYLDNSATTQRPRQVVEAVADYEYHHNSNPFRGLYELSIDATERYEAARTKVAKFINAKSDKEIIFTRNASESLNLVAYSLGEMCLKEGDEVITTVVEHHSNMLPWRLAAKRHGATVKYLECEEDGSFSLEKFKSLLTDKTKIHYDIGIDDRISNLKSCDKKLLFTEFRNKKITDEELEDNKIKRVNNWLDVERCINDEE